MNHTLIFLLFLSSSLFANSLENLPIYCPNEVKCTIDNDIRSCHVSEDPYDIWTLTSAFSWTNNIQGTYKYDSSYGADFYFDTGANTHHLRKQKLIPGIGTCRYTLIDYLGEERDIIAIPMNNLVLLYAHLDSPNLWNVVISDDGSWSNQSCISADPKLCPLTPTPILIYDYENSNLAYFQYGDDATTRKYVLDYNQIFYLCDNKSLCKLNIVTENKDSKGTYYTAGYVTVDISMNKVLNVVNIETNPDSPCLFKKKKYFNLIYCEKKN